MPAHNFPPELQQELAQALREYANISGAGGASERVDAAMNAVCEHAHGAGMTPEAMVIAVRRVYDGVAAVRPPNEERLRGAYDRLLAGCLQMYFEQRGRPG